MYNINIHVVMNVLCRIHERKRTITPARKQLSLARFCKSAISSSCLTTEAKFCSYTNDHIFRVHIGYLALEL